MCLLHLSNKLTTQRKLRGEERVRKQLVETGAVSFADLETKRELVAYHDD